MEEVGAKSTLLLYEIGSTLLKEKDLEYQSLKDPFFSLIKQMEEVSEEMFKQNRQIEIAILATPFKQLFNLFENEEIKSHQDAPLIQGDIGRVLKKFVELQQAVRRIKPQEEFSNQQPSEEKNGN